MPTGRAHYVEALRPGFLQEKRLFSGPFDAIAAAHAERDRLAPLWPDLTLRVVLYSAKTLPDVSPPTPALAASMAIGGYDMSRVGGRRAAAEALRDHALSLGAVAVIEDWDGEPDVDVTTPGIRANIWLMKAQNGSVPIISWHSAAYPLRAVAGAWSDNDGRRKATSDCGSWPAVFDMLATGICASVDGTAFDLTASTNDG